MLFLTSQASNVLHLLLPLLDKKPEELLVAFIPTAADPYEKKSWMENDRNKIVELGFKVFDFDLKDKSEEDIEENLKDVNVIFIAGGNTFYLLEKARKSGFDKLVERLVDKGIVYIGSSAGSVIAGPNIEVVKDFDNPEKADLQSNEGFGLVDFVVLPHSENIKYSVLHNKVLKEYSDKYKIIPITDQQAILVRNNKHQMLEAK